MTILVTGANRGIGLALVKEAKKRGHMVIQTMRKSINKAYYLDLSDLNSIEKFVDELPLEIDVLINNAGILYKDKFGILNYENFLNSFKVNTLGALFLTETLYKRNKLRKKVINITSILGSIELTNNTPSFSYSISKAALNMVTKLLSTNLKGISVISVHPGWVRTDMGGKEAPIFPEESAKGILNIAEQVEDTGTFIDYTGKLLPW
ncbi:short-chain dehydrogenase [Thermosipho melanesiensis]|uniref:Short-chain dehydrogenase/reductase SDR n=2 Tax=Thermosipho melanesiensis TaxID=46541 RepID=A6LKG3_THEM4|nr:SDR family oxidoreductase [Thermosipho melanesiensis]ABR30414.1 short-chain dehydrogenase/reductase SDR [Thermosipho melanesiensis BI429]APT73574.1 short-chain dehydrogenase [Thermosipho melanesiensis]OOC37523.1 short-chain dehydrogenase [Thermosipho melanesiensis]OOC39419.1 short-chain dehydrogenase [Thermosipho melanesiensis]OOC39482.1 short-chain dehydrogenase [Thermosipho melanesiensis]